MAEEGVPTGKTLTDVVDELEHLNAELDQQGADSRRSGRDAAQSRFCFDGDADDD